MKADAKVIPVCPQCGEEITRVKVHTGPRAGLELWTCGCMENLSEQLEWYASELADQFANAVPAIYADKDKLEHVEDVGYRGELLNIIEGMHDFRSWLLDHEELKRRVQERVEVRRTVERRNRV